MRVELVAYTTLATPYAMNAGWRVSGYEPHPPRQAPQQADELAEMAGRLDYQSWDRPNPDTATNDGYLRNIINQGHFSVLEHASASLYVDGVSRTFTHELIRHRHFSFSEMSQRYVDSSNVNIVRPPATSRYGGKDVLLHVAQEAGEAYEELVDLYMSEGLTRKQAREAARSVLINATETKILVTGNMRAWREMLARRLSPSADAEMQQFACEALRILREVAPATFQTL